MAKKNDLDDILKLENQLCFPFYAASRLIVQAYGPSLDKLGITYPQYLVLMVLWENDGLSVKEIGESLYLDSGTLTPLLKKLTDSKLIQRKRDKKDDRIVLNFLTKKGTDLKEKAKDVSYQLFCSTELTIEEATKVRSTVQSLLKRLLKLTNSSQRKQTLLTK